ncbi:putative transcription factor AP2-EREBP family [Helianthus annuus]|nr:putative transcription factor AP2-EREBP family [Helianthus annuus]KAJ0471173.1 putative transcription factor AP2-EREBP family [Helianthus annuus]KAJ0658209.1 putative transcription factor AP2-EREBP family [Helianthus annuus]KAJ0661882.1 putative transcription factor AP2-EREBP family [Helianthus annuus]KAJ0842518.1 putative transcription factor AP2-EREBP family [Helianthus annuus]
MANRRRRSSSASTTNNPPPVPTAGSSNGPHPIYHGIRCRSGKWVSEIREPNKSTRIWLGTYPTPEMAAAAYDVAALALKGAYAVLNFSDSILPSTLPEHPTADDIRAAAASAAAARHPDRDTGVGSSSSSQRGEYMDDEAVFGMPNMLSDMAEGMLISPPRINSMPPDDGDSLGGGNLWDY